MGCPSVSRAYIAPAQGHKRPAMFTVGEAAHERLGLQRLLALSKEGGEGKMGRAGRRASVVHAEDAIHEHYELGNGAGSVWSAVHRDSGRLVAIKTWAAGCPEAAVEEHYLSTFGHRNIARMLEMRRSVLQTHLIMPYYPYSLASILLGQAGGLVMSDVRELSVQLLEALDYVHTQQVVHLSLRPSHLMLNSQGCVKLAHFCRAARLMGTEKRTRVPPPVSNLPYDSPEVLVGDVCSSAADMWSFGCILAEMLLGKPLLQGSSPAQLLRCIMLVVGKPTRQQRTLMGANKALLNTLACLKDCPRDQAASPLMFKLRTLSPEAQALLPVIAACLSMDPDRRPSAADLLRDRAFNPDADSRPDTAASWFKTPLGGSPTSTLHNPAPQGSRDPTPSPPMRSPAVSMDGRGGSESGIHVHTAAVVEMWGHERRITVTFAPPPPAGQAAAGAAAGGAARGRASPQPLQAPPLPGPPPAAPQPHLLRQLSRNSSGLGPLAARASPGDRPSPPQQASSQQQPAFHTRTLPHTSPAQGSLTPQQPQQAFQDTGTTLMFQQTAAQPLNQEHGAQQRLMHSSSMGAVHGLPQQLNPPHPFANCAPRFDSVDSGTGGDADSERHSAPESLVARASLQAWALDPAAQQQLQQQQREEEEEELLGQTLMQHHQTHMQQPHPAQHPRNLQPPSVPASSSTSPSSFTLSTHATVPMPAGPPFTACPPSSLSFSLNLPISASQGPSPPTPLQLKSRPITLRTSDSGHILPPAPSHPPTQTSSSRPLFPAKSYSENNASWAAREVSAATASVPRPASSTHGAPAPRLGAPGQPLPPHLAAQPAFAQPPALPSAFGVAPGPTSYSPLVAPPPASAVYVVLPPPAQAPSSIQPWRSPDGPGARETRYNGRGDATSWKTARARGASEPGNGGPQFTLQAVPEMETEGDAPRGHWEASRRPAPQAWLASTPEAEGDDFVDRSPSLFKPSSGLSLKPYGMSSLRPPSARMSEPGLLWSGVSGQPPAYGRSVAVESSAPQLGGVDVGRTVSTRVSEPGYQVPAPRDSSSFLAAAAAAANTPGGLAAVMALPTMQSPVNHIRFRNLVMQGPGASGQLAQCAR